MSTIGSDRLRKAAAIAREVENVVARQAPDLGKPAAILSGQLVAAIASLPEKQQRALAASRRSILDAFVAQLKSAVAPDQSSDSAPSKNAQAPEHSAIEEIRVSDWAGPTAGPTYLEKHYGISRSTLHRWQKRNLVIALRRGGRKYVFPLEQFVDGRPVSGLDQIIGLFEHPRLAWAWLRTPSPKLAEKIPLELLKLDQVASAVCAAKNR